MSMNYSQMAQGGSRQYVSNQRQQPSYQQRPQQQQHQQPPDPPRHQPQQQQPVQHYQRNAHAHAQPTHNQYSGHGGNASYRMLNAQSFHVHPPHPSDSLHHNQITHFPRTEPSRNARASQSTSTGTSTHGTQQSHSTSPAKQQTVNVVEPQRTVNAVNPSNVSSSQQPMQSERRAVRQTENVTMTPQGTQQPQSQPSQPAASERHAAPQQQHQQHPQHQQHQQHQQQAAASQQMTAEAGHIPLEATDSAVKAEQAGLSVNTHDDQSSGTTPKKKPFSSQSNVNSKIMFGTRYEVKCDETFAYYEGYVFDFDQKENKLKVAYGWKDDQTVPVNYVRPLAPPIPPNWKPVQGDHVECQAKAEESEPYGWWDCSIKTVRDSLYLITYEGWDNHHEVLQHNMLRPYNDQEPFEEEGVVRATMDMDQAKIDSFNASADMRSDSQQSSFMDPNGFGDDTSSSPTMFSFLKRIAAQTRLIHLNYSPEEAKLVLIGTRGQVRDAKMLVKFLWRLQDTNKTKESYIKDSERRIKEQYEELRNCHEVKFEFPISLTRYVIGQGGSNIQKAKDISSVKHINVRASPDDPAVGECIILANDHDGAVQARDILEMSQDFEIIPKRVKKDLIGKDGSNVKELEQRASVIKICTLEHLQNIRRLAKNNPNARGSAFQTPFDDEAEPEDENYCKLIIIGPKGQVPFAKMMIQTETEVIEQKIDFMERQREAARQMNDDGYGYDDNYGNSRGGGGGGRGGGAGYDDGYYDQYDGGYDNGGQYNGSPSRRRERRRGQYNEQQQATGQSNRGLDEFNYNTNQKRRERRERRERNNNNNNNNRNRNGRDQRDGRDGKREDMSNGNHDAKDVEELDHEDHGNGNGKSWTELADEGDQENGGQNGGRGGGNGGKRGRGGGGNNGRGGGGGNKSTNNAGASSAVWKAKQPATGANGDENIQEVANDDNVTSNQ